MDAIALLKADHQKVKELFRHYEAAGTRAYQKKKSIADEICTAISLHSRSEGEEGEIFPEAEEVLGDALTNLGARMQQRKEQLMASVPATGA